MTDTATVPTTPTAPFPGIEYGLKTCLGGVGFAPLAKYSPKSGLPVVTKYLDPDYGPKAEVHEYDTKLRVPWHGGSRVTVQHIGCGESMQKEAASPSFADGEAADYDVDLISLARCTALDHTRRERFTVRAHLVSVFMQRLRAEAVDEISRPVRLPARKWVTPHEVRDQGVHLMRTACDGKTQAQASPAPEASAEYPVANDIYEPVEHWWTPERAGVLRALKDYSEATHADR